MTRQKSPLSQSRAFAVAVSFPRDRPLSLATYLDARAADRLTEFFVEPDTCSECPSSTRLIRGRTERRNGSVTAVHIGGQVVRVMSGVLDIRDAK